MQLNLISITQTFFFHLVKSFKGTASVNISHQFVYSSWSPIKNILIQPGATKPQGEQEINRRWSLRQTLQIAPVPWGHLSLILPLASCSLKAAKKKKWKPIKLQNNCTIYNQWTFNSTIINSWNWE